MNILDIAIAKKLAGGGGGSGTDNYNDLSNLPKINGTTLSGNKSSSALGLQSEINSDSKLASDLVDDANHTNKFVTSTEKQTWNAKQNAIDADHKLSSSLVSFTTAEAAALASGIDSSKVGQISTNQTNILYALEVGAKNLFRWDKWVNDCNVVGGTKTISFGVMTLTSSSTNCYTEYEGSSYPDVEIPVKANEQYVMTWENWRISGSSRGTVYVVFVGSTGAATASASAEVKKIEFTTPTGTTGLRVYIKQTTDALIENYSDFMICSKTIWDTLGHNYQPPSVSNYDLTRLEAEDRDVLAEVVDSGAKNLLDFANLVSLKTQNATVTKTDTTVTVTSNNTWGYQSYLLDLRAGKYELSFNATAVSISSGRMFVAVFPGKTAEGHIVQVDVTSTGAKHGSFEWTGGELNISFYANPSNVQIVNSMTITDVMICTEADWKMSQNFAPHALPNTDLTRMVSELQKKAVKVYTYHVNPNESDPEDAVTYLDDATGLTPAKMGASSFSYGSWTNAWFLPRPCMLKSDGTVAYYLNPNDYSKKTDGTASDIADLTFDGNVMLEFPKIWVKRVDEGNGARTVSIAPVNVDGTYKCWSNINAEDKEVDHFYLPAYNGTIHSSKMRSLSGVTLNSTYAPNYTRAQEVTAATANNPTGKNLWYTETWADMCLVYDLLYLMGKSLDVQRTFGQGLSSGSETAMRAYVTGTHNAKGLFYGDVSGTSTAVKVLGMENLWGCRWHGVAGLINDNGTLKVKMTYGVADGSTTVGYNTTGSGYLNYGSTYGTNGFVKKMQADNTMGYKIIETAGTDTTYYCDYYYTNNIQSNYALLGGGSDSVAGCGFFVHLGSEAAFANWNLGGSLSCRPEA